MNDLFVSTKLSLLRLLRNKSTQSTFQIIEAVGRRCSDNFVKFKGKHLYQSFFLNKVAGLLCKICQNAGAWIRLYRIRVYLRFYLYARIYGPDKMLFLAYFIQLAVLKGTPAHVFSCKFITFLRTIFT